MTYDDDTATLRWALVLPVKRLQLAKSRLDVAAGVRPALVLAMVRDTVAAALACDAVAHVVVVTDDRQARGELEPLGVTVVRDVPGAGLNEALAYGAGIARALTGHAMGAVAACSADLPAARPEDFATALGHARSQGRAFVPDRAGDGTTLLAAGAGKEFTPAFGALSSRRHRDLGYAELLDAPPRLRCDVDTLDDLAVAAGLGVGRSTYAVIEQLDAVVMPQPRDIAAKTLLQ